MRKSGQKEKARLGVMVLLAALVLVKEAYPSEFPPKQMCLVDKNTGNLVLIANCKPAGPKIKLSDSTYKLYTVNALIEGGPLSGTGGFFFPPYFDLSLAGGGYTWHYFVDLRLDPGTREGSCAVYNVDLDTRFTAEVRLVPCNTIP